MRPRRNIREVKSQTQLNSCIGKSIPKVRQSDFQKRYTTRGSKPSAPTKWKLL